MNDNVKQASTVTAIASTRRCATVAQDRKRCATHCPTRWCALRKVASKHHSKTASVDRTPALRTRTRELFSPAPAPDELRLAPWAALRFPEQHGPDLEQEEAESNDGEPRIPPSRVERADQRRYRKRLAPACETLASCNRPIQARLERRRRRVSHRNRVCRLSSTESTTRWTGGFNFSQRYSALPWHLEQTPCLCSQAPEG